MITTGNIETVPVSVLIDHRREVEKLPQSGNRFTTLKVIDSVIADRLPEFELRVDNLQRAKDLAANQVDFRLFCQIRRDHEQAFNDLEEARRISKR